MTMRGSAGESINRADGDGDLLATLVRQDLPPRVRALLEGMLARCRTYFGAALVRTLDEIELELFRCAERSANNAVQAERFADLREVKRARGAVTPHFFQHVEARLARMRHATRHANATWKPRTETVQPALELIDSAVLDEELALQDIANKSEMRHGQALYALAHRLGVIAGTPAWANDTLPLGPAQLAAAFRHALREISLDTEQRVLAYRQFERSALAPIGAFYDRLGAWLASERILPNLSIQSAFRRGDASVETQAQGAPATGAPAMHESPAPVSVPSSPAADVDDEEMFKTLRGLLEARRESWGAVLADTPTFHASDRDLQDVLGALQRSPASRSAQAAPYDSDHFKNVFAVKLRRASPEGHPLRLADEDSDTVDLVGMLFDYIAGNVRSDSGAQTLLTRLHVPVLRVALGDKTFFTRRDHPARALLNAIADTGTRWIDASDPDPELLGKLQRVVDQVGAEFDGDVALFDRQLQDLGRHMAMLGRRAEMAERRHIDAAKGRDRLDVARENARGAIAQALEHGDATPAVRTLLEHAWTDALALSALRQEEHGPEFRRRVEVAREIVQRKPAPAGDARDEALRRDLDVGLRQVGLHDEDVRGVLGSLFPPVHAADAPPRTAELERIANTLRDKTRLGGETHTARPATTSTPIVAGSAEAAMLEKLHKIPFGTWFDFVTNQQGAEVRRKLAWFSTLTGRCLFVNQRGARTEDHSLDQLARDLVRGQVRIVSAEAASLIDRAWKAITEVLRPGGADAAGVKS